MKMPRGVTAERLLSVLEKLGYRVIRQRGSHIRLQHPGPPEHSVTVPRHRPLRVGTLHAILTEVAQQRSATIEAIVEQL